MCDINCQIWRRKHDGLGLFFWIQNPESPVGYHSILQRYGVLSVMHVVGQGFILQQDNDPKHKSKLYQNYLRKKDQEGKLENIFSIKNWKNSKTYITYNL